MFGLLYAMDPFSRDESICPSEQRSDPRQQANRVIVDEITNDRFQEWFQQREFARNIREGQSYFNGASVLDNPYKHSPSKLVQCHRQIYYKDYSAPKEGTAPKGLFWIGSNFEEEVIMPFLESITTDETYVQNSIWVDTEIEHDGLSEPLVVKGMTDPAIVTADAEPRIVTEVKTTSSIEYLDDPHPHHRAQLMAYLFALQQEQDHPIDGLILYADRTTFELKAFHLQFDSKEWWKKIVPWMVEQTQYRKNEKLPPADPPKEWACDYCSFRERCGIGDSSVSDMQPTGFVPGIVYQREAVADHLDAHSTVELTQKLSSLYPSLV